MKKKGNKNKLQLQKPPKPPIAFKDSTISSLNLLANKRTGGANNIKGISFQLVYSCYLILNKLSDFGKIRLEGVEDLDYLTQVNTTEYIQLKSSKNNITPSSFWDTSVLQNFLEIFKVDSNARFKLVYNSGFTNDILKEIATKNISNETVLHWKNKFISEDIDISNVDVETFLRSIEFEKVNENELQQKCLSLLIEKFELNNGTEMQFFNALFNTIFTWSKERREITSNDIITLIQSVKESFSKHVQNPAIQNNWINEVLFEPTTSDLSDYFDGKAAKPIHISNNLPVRRKKWEDEIENSINNFDITLIKSSSGQGKSTLAWMISKVLSLKGYTIFQLNRCTEEQVPHLIDFIKSRIKIGQIPLIVVDGLSPIVDQWGILAEGLQDYLVKILITSREEDWYRYGFDLSRIRLKFIDIKLTFEEAQGIFLQLKGKGKLHNSINKWQPAWEKIETKGLLIEYIYLLTQGQMIAERLTEQIKQLNREKSAAAKLEILRLVSLADILNIKLETSKLTNYINSTIHFENDRNEVYQQLKKEYYLKFDTKYIEGLHPVRSKHLTDALHSNISIKETLINLLPIVDSEFVYTYFITAPELVDKDQRKEFYEQSAKSISNRKFSEMVYAIDGLMHYEPYYYWKENKAVFDEVFNNGSIQLFVSDTLPFQKLNTINNFKETAGIKYTNLTFLSEKLNQLTDYNISNSDLIYFVKALQDELTHKQLTSYEGLGFLVKWFTQLNIAFPLVIELNETLLLKSMRGDLGEAAELFHYYHLADPEKFKEFITQYRKEIIALLKVKTNTLTIEEKEGNIYMNYLLDNNHTDKVNDYSVYRINMVHEFLPIYEKYCTKLILLPFPNEEIYKVVVQNSFKEMPKENIANVFNVHINQIWIKVILDRYRAESVYEWQKQYIEIRLKAIEVIKKCTRFFEAQIEKDQSKIGSTVKTLIHEATLLIEMFKKVKEFPSHTSKYYEKSKYKAEENKITNWQASFTNFLTQMSGIVSPKESNDRNLATVNLKDTVFKLPEMQEAFSSIVNNTFEYLPNSNMLKEEDSWYNRLLKTVLFYIHLAQKSDKSSKGYTKSAVEDWFESDEKARITLVKEVLKNYEMNSHFIFHCPNKVIQKEILKEIVIGVEGLNLEDPEARDVLDLSAGLYDLDKTDIDFFTFVKIESMVAISGFRVGKNYFERIRNYFDSGLVEDAVYGNPMVAIINEEIAECIPGLKMMKAKPNENDETFFTMMFDAWKLKEYRDRLNLDVEIEKEWLSRLEMEYKELIENSLMKIKTAYPPQEYAKYATLLTDFLNKNSNLSIDEIVLEMNEKAQEIYNSRISNIS